MPNCCVLVLLVAVDVANAKAELLILRVSCIAASGNVDIDVTQIEQAMVKRPVII